MKILKFEYQITLAYWIIGSLWILFSDNILSSNINNTDLLTHGQTYKGWFYVIVTGVLFFFFLKKHLSRLRKTEQELEHHKNNLQQLVDSKTEALDAAIEHLEASNEILSQKNEIINTQNLELKEALDHLKETQSQLFQAEIMASLGVLTAGVAHEINNPLNYILGGVTGLESYFKGDIEKNEQLKLFIESIKTGVYRASLIVTSLNQLSRSKGSYSEACHLHKIIDDCLILVNSQLGDRINVIRDFTGIDLIVPGNSGQLHQAIVNILINAIQGIENKGSIVISTEMEEDQACLKITDTGHGISQENLPRITDFFFTTKEPGKGAGLGLSVTYNIIKAHKGTLSFESELHKGTTVKICLPINSLRYGETQDFIRR